jgi:orotidine-5'-phosphate decarboxylase
LKAAERIIVALDCPERKAAEIARFLKGIASWMKVGMTLYYKSGPAIVAKLRGMGHNVFVDLKLHDIPHQVQGAAKAVVEAGANMLTVHASGGLAMMQAAVQGVEEAWSAKPAKGTVLDRYHTDARPKVLAVTVLTSLDDAVLHSVGVAANSAEQVALLASLARQAGCDGVVCSPQEAAAIRALWPEALIVTPGIRLEESGADDQARIATPDAALQAGADYLVIGRNITNQAEPGFAFEQIVHSIRAA